MWSCAGRCEGVKGGSAEKGLRAVGMVEFTCSLLGRRLVTLLLLWPLGALEVGSAFPSCHSSLWKFVSGVGVLSVEGPLNCSLRYQLLPSLEVDSSVFTKVPIWRLWPDTTIQSGLCL